MTGDDVQQDKPAPEKGKSGQGKPENAVRYSPNGTKVTVSKAQADKLKGYSNKPK